MVLLSIVKSLNGNQSKLEGFVLSNQQKKKLTYSEIEEMMQNAVFDSVVQCPYCQYGNLESDYKQCPECNKKNPLMAMGLI